jgi:DNA repair protein RadC
MDNSFTIHDLPPAERPRERLKAVGADNLSSQELLAILIGRGIPGKSAITIANELVSRFHGVQGIGEATIEELSAVKGVGLAKAAQIKAAFAIGKRRDLEKEEIYPDPIKDPKSLVKAVRASIQEKAKEHFKIAVLNTRNRITRILNVSTGTLNASLVHPREVFRDAISHSASSIILVHNHPSDDPEPSDDDLTLTRRLVDAGRLMGIEVLDHIIITRKGFTSFKEKGLL